ncbi:MAG: helix-turn-helix domain-containing protein [Patescibacteria group bacterium]|nr:helix-turn-helix domain-containing protein [Patescibacteria group bacterium]
MVFVVRKLDRVPQTLGEKLRALRRGQAVSLDMMERKTHIQRRYLEALERGNYDVLPEPLYTRNFISAYARVLHADEHYFIELYLEECGKCDLVEPMRTPRQRVSKARFFVWTRLLTSFAFILVALSIISYLGWQIKAIIEPPDIIIFTPIDSTITTQPVQQVEGAVNSEATVYINGEQVVLDADHNFSTEVDLQKGLNEIVIEAERRYSKRRQEIRRVVFDPQETP